MAGKQGEKCLAKFCSNVLGHSDLLLKFSSDLEIIAEMRNSTKKPCIVAKGSLSHIGQWLKGLDKSLIREERLIGRAHGPSCWQCSINEVCTDVSRCAK